MATKKKNTTPETTPETTPKTVDNTADNKSVLIAVRNRSLELIKSIRSDYTAVELTESQKSYLEKHTTGDTEKAVVRMAFESANVSEVSTMDKYFGMYLHFGMLWNANNKLKLGTFLSSVAPQYNIDVKSEAENIRKTFKAFEKYFTSPENAKLFRQFSITNLRLLSLVEDTSIVIKAVIDGTISPKMTKAKLKEWIDSIKGTAPDVDTLGKIGESGDESGTDSDSDSDSDSGSGTDSIGELLEEVNTTVTTEQLIGILANRIKSESLNVTELVNKLIELAK